MGATDIVDLFYILPLSRMGGIVSPRSPLSLSRPADNFVVFALGSLVQLKSDVDVSSRPSLVDASASFSFRYNTRIDSDL
jgi:hypothetical protein